MTAYLQAGAFVILALLLGYAVHYAGRLYGRDEEAARAVRTKARQAAASPSYTISFPAYFVRPLHGEPTYDVGVYVMGSSDAAIAERLVLASRKVMQ